MIRAATALALSLWLLLASPAWTGDQLHQGSAVGTGRPVAWPWAVIPADLRAYDASGRDLLADRPATARPSVATSSTDTSYQHRPQATRRQPPIWIWLAVALVAGAAAGWRPPEKWRMPAGLVALAAVLAGMTWLRLAHLNLPFDTDQLTQRVFFASLPVGEILDHRYSDTRHPPLFYAVLHPVVWASQEEWAARLPAALTSVIAAGIWAGAAAQRFGWLRAVLTAALLALNTALLFESREVSDLPMFLALAAVSTWALIRAIDSGDRRWGLALLAGEVAMFWTYYLAPVVILSHAMAFAAFRKPSSRRDASAGVVLALLLATPELENLRRLLFADAQLRQQATRMADHLWGALDPTEVLAQLQGLLVPTGWTGGLAMALVALGFVRLASEERGPWAVVLGGWTGIGLTGSLVAASFLRLKAYYLLILLPPLALLAVIGALGPRPEAQKGAFGRLSFALGAAALAAVLGGSLTDLRSALPKIHHPEKRDDVRQLGRLVHSSAEGPDRVVADPNYLHTALLFYFFDEPLARYPTCEIPASEPGAGTRCLSRDGALYTLTSLPEMREGWELASLERFRALRDQPLWFVYTPQFVNRPLHAELRATCRLVHTQRDLQLYRCP